MAGHDNDMEVDRRAELMSDEQTQAAASGHENRAEVTEGVPQILKQVQTREVSGSR